MESSTLLTPLSIILAFIGVIEATLAYRVTKLQGKPQLIFVWFMVCFPLLVLFGFFYVQLTEPLSWYPPGELAKAPIEHLDYLDVQGRNKEIDISVALAFKSTRAEIPKGCSDLSYSNLSELLNNFEEILEKEFWPEITKQFEAIKNKETKAKESLALDPNSNLLRAQYRLYGIGAEYLLRIAYKKESESRKEFLDNIVKLSKECAS